MSISKNNSTKLGSIFRILYHSTRDKELIEKLVKFFGCGYIINDTPMKVKYKEKNYNYIQQLFSVNVP